MARNKPTEILKTAFHRLEKANEVIRRFNIQGVAAQAKAVALATTLQKLRLVCVTPSQRIGPGEPIPTGEDALSNTVRAFVERHPGVLERLEQAVAGVESSPPAELSDGAQSILRLLGKDVNPADRDLVWDALTKVDAIQPIIDTLD